MKIKLALEQATKPQMGRGYNSTLSLTPALDGVGGHPPATLPPVKIPGTHCTGGWVGPMAGLDGCGKSRPPPTGIRSQDRPARSEFLYQLRAIRALRQNVSSGMFFFFQMKCLNPFRSSKDEPLAIIFKRFS